MKEKETAKAITLKRIHNYSDVTVSAKGMKVVSGGFGGVTTVNKCCRLESLPLMLSYERACFLC